MQWTGLNELREKFLAFFENKGHLRLSSFSLIPQNDKSLLLINSGMAPMKKYFTGEVTPPRKRVTTCQKCIRTPDIDRVGKTARHGTYFEMLGNFSFGDYFKVEATEWAWEFCLKVLEMPLDKLWVTIYQDDEEAFDIWTQRHGVDLGRIVRMGKEDNFWEHGVGPCGPCSEIYFDRGEQYGCDSPSCGVGCDCDRYVEFWNLVFTQFDSDGKGNYAPLDHPNIDTGMGLERLACILQGVDNLFEVDTVQKIMGHVMQIAGVKYKEDPKTDVSLRVITDHIRSTTFMIGDGVMPSNEGRGYVLRRLLRRAARHGRLLGIHEPFLAKVSKTVIAENESAYPQLKAKEDFIEKLIVIEEENFSKTIDTGLQLLENLLQNTQGKEISGADAFKLYDTFGFPIDLTKEILFERGFTVEEEGFQRLMKEQRERARNARKDAGADAWKSSSALLDEMPETLFLGYETLRCDQSKVLALLSAQGDMVETLDAGEEGTAILDRSPFYAESGGQAGDTGSLAGENLVCQINNTTKTSHGVFLHTVKVRNGTLRVGDLVSAQVDEEMRQATMRNHTAAHLFHAALRKVLGVHVQQAGQLVDARYMRFDFTHFSPMTPAEIEAVEQEVNACILAAVAVTSTEMTLAEAQKLGAMALFNEKYGERVRVVQAGNYSMELCGGTHVDNTGKMGLFKIITEASVAAGIRRIEAVTGYGVMELIHETRENVQKAADAMKLGDIKNLAGRAAQLMQESKTMEREIDTLRSQIASLKMKALLEQAKEIKGIKLITAVFADTPADAVRTMCDIAKANDENIVVVIAGVQAEKGTVSFAAGCGKQAVAKGAHAGNIVRAVAQVAGGSGGGKPDSAMAGAKDPGKAQEAIAAVEGIIGGMIQA